MSITRVWRYIKYSISMLNRKYPRNCYNCNTKLNLTDFINTNLKDNEKYYYSKKKVSITLKNTFDNLIKIWCSEIIELYCCTCYTNIKRKELEKAIKECHKKYFEYRDD